MVLPRYVRSFFCVLLAAQVAMAQTLDVSSLQSSAKRLSVIFADLKRLGLGADQLQEEYSKTNISYSRIDVQELLDSMQSNNRVQNVINVINQVASGTTVATVEDCCSPISGSPCCYGCGDVTSLEVETAAHVISDGQSETRAEFKVGFSNGSLLVFPPPLQEGSCDSVGFDARIQSWYNLVTSAKSKEVVIFLDINENGLVGNSSLTQLKEAAISVIQSLSAEDRVALVITDDFKQRTCPPSLRTATHQTKQELLRIIDTSVLTENRQYPKALESALNYFTSSSTTEKHLLLLTNGLTGFGTEAVEDFQAFDSTNFTNINFTIYSANNNANNPLFGHLNGLAGNSAGILQLADVASYAVDDSVLPSNELFITTEFNRANELSLSISKPWIDDSELVGVVNVLLPWRFILSEIEDATTPRPSSYYFLLNQNGTMLYHDLFEEVNVFDVDPLRIETENEFKDDVHATITGGQSVASSISVVKSLVINQDGSNGFHTRPVPSSYTCRQVITITNSTAVTGAGVIHACVVMATEDVSVLDTFNIQNIENVYRGSPSRLPLYNSLLSTANSSEICNSFCLLSVDGRFSIQLTSPLNASTSSPADVDSYIRGSGMKPSDIEDNIAEEVAVVSIVGEEWLKNQYRSEVVQIKRRHLATPTGIYLSFPAVQLNSLFVPRYLSWYIGATSNRDVLYLTASSNDPLDDGEAIYTASYPVINNGVVLSVLAADMTESSLRHQIEQTFDTCKQSNYDCSVINSHGEFVVYPPGQKKTSIIDQYGGISQALHRNGILVNQGCRDLSDTETSFRLYYSISMDNSPTGIRCFNSNDGCQSFCIAAINGTDSFLLIVNNNCPSTGLVFCNPTTDCFRCDLSSVQCPCPCNENICEEVSELNVPTCPYMTTPPSNYGYHDNSRTNEVNSANQCQEEQCCDLTSSHCEVSPHCNWCPTQSTCLPLGTCCSNGIECCANLTTRCLINYCARDSGNSICPTRGTMTTAPPTKNESSIDRQGAIIGGVIGGVFGVILLALLIVCCVWYQFCRPDSDEQSKTKSDFNFTDIKVATTNKTAIELKGVEPLPENGAEPEPKEKGVPV